MSRFKKKIPMKNKLIKTIDIKKNITLNLYDSSKKLAGDRWLIKLIIQMEIPVTEALIREDYELMDIVTEMKKVLGEKVLFEQVLERIFIDEANKETVLKELTESFLNNTLSYFSHEEFPKRYVLKKYKEMVEKETRYH
jgi:hypothetical protein